MKQVAVYAAERRTNALRKESLIYDSIDTAFDSMPDVTWSRRDMPDGASTPGLREYRSHEKIVALGRAAHTVLADYRKQTLVTGQDVEDALDEDVERLVWSCINTSKVVALGHGAWRSIQMLPIAERRFYDLPPLKMAPRRDGRPATDIGTDILVINHEASDVRARQVAAALERDGYVVQRTERGGGGGGDGGGWSAGAAIHVHVGCHDSKSEELRLLDSWYSRRFAILILPDHVARNPPSGSLMVDPEINGFLCDTPEMVLAACADLRADPVLRKKMLDAGAASVAPLARGWLAIATELVS